MAGAHRLADGRFAGCVVAVRVVDADAFGVAFEIALHFERAPVGEFVVQRRRVARAGPRPPRIFVAAAEPVERREQRRPSASTFRLRSGRTTTLRRGSNAIVRSTNFPKPSTRNSTSLTARSPCRRTPRARSAGRRAAPSPAQADRARRARAPSVRARCSRNRTRRSHRRSRASRASAPKRSSISAVSRRVPGATLPVRRTRT